MTALLLGTLFAAALIGATAARSHSDLEAAITEHTRAAFIDDAAEQSLDDTT